MYFLVRGISDYRSPKLPYSVERAFGVLLEPDGEINSDTLSRVIDHSIPDSNIDRVTEILDHEVVADGSEALRLVLDGLRQRLEHPSVVGETILLRGD